MEPKKSPLIRSCPACDSREGKYKGEKKGFTLFSCQACGTLYTSEVPDVNGGKNYDDYYVPENLTIPAFLHQRLDEIVSSFAVYRHNNRLLDLGCGIGLLMQAAARAGWVAEGVEISRAAVEYVRKQHYGTVFCGRLDEAQYPANHFDVVASSEVLEHVDDPRVFVSEVARVLRPGGLLWLTTPHGRGLSAKLLGLNWSVVSPPDHLQLLSRAGSRKLLAAVGLRQVRVMTEGVNPFELLNSLRSRGAQDPPEANSQRGNERVETSYHLNEALMANSSRRLVKKTINGLLNLSRLGDSLKIWAEK